MAKSKEELISMIENDLVDPSTNKITGERVKNALTEMVDAMGTGGGGGNMEYWSVPEEAREDAALLAMFAPWAKAKMGSTTYIAGSAVMTLTSSMTLAALAVDTAATVVWGPDSGTFYELLSKMGILSLEDVGCVQITKEEFYTI